MATVAKIWVSLLLIMGSDASAKHAPSLTLLLTITSRGGLCLPVDGGLANGNALGELHAFLLLLQRVCNQACWVAGRIGYTVTSPP